MTVGYLSVGSNELDVAFEVSSDLIETFNNMKVNKSVAYTTHKIHGHKAVVEMTGIEADTITFDMLLSAYLGVNPQSEINKLERIMANGRTFHLILGGRLMGTWVIKSMPYNVEYVYMDGTITQAKVTVSLLEAVIE